MPKSELGGTREIVDQFVERLQVERGNKNEKGEADALGNI